MKHSRRWGWLCIVALTVAACSSSSNPTTTNATTSTSVGTETTTDPGTAPTSSTSTTAAPTTSSTSTTTSTTTAPALIVEIVKPKTLATLSATIDRGQGELAAVVRLEARVDGDGGSEATVEWTSSIDGVLGTGLTLQAQLSNGGTDVIEHEITATAQADGLEATASVRVIVAVPSG